MYITVYIEIVLEYIWAIICMKICQIGTVFWSTPVNFPHNLNFSNTLNGFLAKAVAISYHN